MEKRCLREVCGSCRAFLSCASAVAISPTSPYKRRNWLYSADQDRDSEWWGAEGVAERAPKQEERGGQEGRVNSKRTLEFHSKN